MRSRFEHLCDRHLLRDHIVQIGQEAVLLAGVQFYGAEDVGELKAVDHHAGFVGEGSGLDDVHAPCCQRTCHISKQARAIAHYEGQVAEAVKFLNAAREEYKGAGFEVETIRVVTQPLAAYSAGMKHADRVALLRKFGELAGKLGFAANLGAVQLTDDDDRSMVDLAIDVFASTKINGSLVIAADDGIHWKSIGEAARLVKAVAAKSRNGGGNMNFAATAMVKPYGPFYPGAWHNGPGKAFSVGLESANVVAEVLAQFHDPGPAGTKLADALRRHLMRAEAAATRIAADTKWAYAGIDPTPAPLGDVSIGRAIENFIGAPFGSGGTLTAASVITRAVQAAPVKQEIGRAHG